MALLGFAPKLRWSCCDTPLVGKSCTPLQSIKPIRIAVPTVLGELRFGHTTRFLGGMFLWCELFLEGVRQLCRELLRMRSLVAFKLVSVV